jgi:hypothetical protein
MAETGRHWNVFSLERCVMHVMLCSKKYPIQPINKRIVNISSSFFYCLFIGSCRTTNLPILSPARLNPRKLGFSQASIIGGLRYQLRKGGDERTSVVEK